MRTGGVYNANGGATMAKAPSMAPGGPHSGWHSPVPYLFGGLAAMLGLIALALLILACSYWKLSSYLESGDGADQPNHEKPSDGSAGKETAFVEESVLVIMAGNSAPTFLAIPTASGSVSLVGNSTAANTDLDESNKQEDTDMTRDSRPMEGGHSQHQSQNQEL
ncbi:protein GLUTAMINE DUMPER 3-like [Musa acuminata AAA Group]|uniref:protein GLUTAMINE DUMPER 3-like n=1 Tax=Musa acuminata AAA Group TaxID=214697 RepID=UPI0031DF3EC7